MGEYSEKFKCPSCRKTLLKITVDSVFKNEIFCPRCKQAYMLDIVGLKMNKCVKVRG